MIKPITVRLPDKLQKELQKISRKERISLSDIIRESLREYVAVKRFRHLRKSILPLAEGQGLLTDEDIFKIIS